MNIDNQQKSWNSFNMKINHLFIPSTDLKKSVAFFCDLFGFEKTVDFPVDDTLVGQTLHGNFDDRNLDLLILPIKENKLPYPHHLALEVNTNELEILFQKANRLNLHPRSEVDLNSTNKLGAIQMNSIKYKNFFVLDPSRINIEIMAIE